MKVTKNTIKDDWRKGYVNCYYRYLKMEKKRQIKIEKNLKTKTKQVTHEKHYN